MKVELTGIHRFFSVTDDTGKEWTVTEMFDENSDSTVFTVVDEEGYEPEQGEEKDKILDAVEVFLERL